MRAALACSAALAAAFACGAPRGGTVDVAASDAPPARVDEPPEVDGFTAAEVRALLRLSPLPEPPPDPSNAVYEDPRAARLGQFLFFDPRLSASGATSCATCHDPARHWTDGRALAVGEGALTRHTMTLWNVAFQRWFFWDGRADTLWAQALQPLEDPREHGTTRLEVAHLIARDPDLRRAYEDVFGALPPLEDAARFPAAGRPMPDDPDHPHARAWSAMSAEDRRAVDHAFANVGKAIAAFERKLVARETAFDEFVAGVRARDPYRRLALSPSAQSGLRLFLGKARCVLCHGGPELSDREFHDNRVPPLGGGTRLDPGRYAGIEGVQRSAFGAAGEHSDAEGEAREAAREKVAYLLRAGHTWSEFKTPSLRNVVLTPPYMHQGQLATLDEVIEHYDTLERAVPTHHQGESTLVPLGLTAEERADLKDFLESLTDPRLDPELARQPETPWLP